MYCGFSWLIYYNQSPDWIKALWVLSLPGFVAFMSALALWFILSVRRIRLEERRLEVVRALPASRPDAISATAEGEEAASAAG